MNNQYTYDMRHIREAYRIRVLSASGATNDVGCVRAVLSIFDVKCARVVTYLFEVYDMRRVRTSLAYCSSGIIYDARCIGAVYCTYDVRSRTLSCKVLSNVDRYESIGY